MLTLQILISCAIAGLILAGRDISERECECGLENTQSRVFYGTEVASHKYPWLTHIKLDKNNVTVSCGGSLIDSRRVLTAAHCVHDRDNRRIPAKDIRVYLGIHSKKEADKTVMANRVSHYEVGRLYPTVHGYDIALLVLEEPVKFTRTVSPICISAYDSNSYLKNKKLTVAGWGISHLKPDETDPENMVPATSTIPMEAEVDFVPVDVCKMIYKEMGLSFIDSVDAVREICAYNFDTYADACGGDSGGPLMYKNPDDNRWYLAGVVARGRNCPNHSGVPGTYTKLRSLRDSIETMDNPEDFCLNCYFKE